MKDNKVKKVTVVNRVSPGEVEKQETEPDSKKCLSQLWAKK